MPHVMCDILLQPCSVGSSSLKMPQKDNCSLLAFNRKNLKGVTQSPLLPSLRSGKDICFLETVFIAR